MSEQKPKIGKKGAGREIARALSEIRKKPVSEKLINIVNEISEKEKRRNKNELKSNIFMDSAKSHILLLTEKVCFLVDICNIYVTFVTYRTTGVRYVF